MGGLTRCDSIDASDEAADDGRGMRDAVVGIGMRLRDEPGRVNSGRGFTFRSLVTDIKYRKKLKLNLLPE